MSFNCNKIHFNVTLRQFCGELPTNIFNWQKNNPYISLSYTEVVDLSLLPPPGPLKSTDSEGYYCNKLGGKAFIKHYMKPGMTLKETMLECVEFFLFRDGGLTTHDDEEYVSEYANHMIEELLSAYQHMRSEYNEEDTDNEDDDCECHECEDDCDCECHVEEDEECDCDECEDDCDCECHDDDDSDYVPDSDDDDDDDDDDNMDEDEY